MEMLGEFLKAFPFVGSVLQYHGGMSLKERNVAIDASHKHSTDGKQDVFLIQLQAGGTGINLQHYDRIVFISPWWTSALLDQALGRAIRIGQKNVVKVYWLRLKAETDFNIDNFMMEKAETKRELGLNFLSWSIGRAEYEAAKRAAAGEDVNDDDSVSTPPGVTVPSTVHETLDEMSTP
jgi:SNF2 family DNA or RNA helicase